MSLNRENARFPPEKLSSHELSRLAAPSKIDKCLRRVHTELAAFEMRRS